MARKRKTDQPKLADMEAMLRKLEAKTAHDVKERLGDQWRDNLFEILMTRLDLVSPDKKVYASIPSALRKEPKEIPKFAKLFFKTMHNLLKLAKAPAQPHHTAAFSVLYATVVDTFLKDDTRDHAKTMAAIDKRLGLFEQFVNCDPCKELKRQPDHHA